MRWPGGVRWPVAFFSDLVAQWLILAAGFSSAIHLMCIEPFSCILLSNSILDSVQRKIIHKIMKIEHSMYEGNF